MDRINNIDEWNITITLTLTDSVVAGLVGFVDVYCPFNDHFFGYVLRNMHMDIVGVIMRDSDSFM